MKTVTTLIALFAIAMFAMGMGYLPRYSPGELLCANDAFISQAIEKLQEPGASDVQKRNAEHTIQVRSKQAEYLRTLDNSKTYRCYTSKHGGMLVMNVCPTREMGCV